MKKNKFRTWVDPMGGKTENSEMQSKTMPDMEVNPRTVIENHVRGINPITGAVLDKGIYYGENVLPYEKDLTYEELRLKRIALSNQVNNLKTKIMDPVLPEPEMETDETDGNGDDL